MDRYQLKSFVGAPPGEIEDAMDGPLPAADLDGVRRRTRALLGRCQGFHCLAEVSRMLEHRPG